jgi:hypothetical protein
LKRPVFVTRSLFREVDDQSETLSNLGETGEEGEQA